MAWEGEVLFHLNIYALARLVAFLATKGALSRIKLFAGFTGWVFPRKEQVSYSPGARHRWSLSLPVYDGDRLQQAQCPHDYEKRGILFKTERVFSFIRERLEGKQSMRHWLDPMLASPGSSTLITNNLLPNCDSRQHFSVAAPSTHLSSPSHAAARPLPASSWRKTVPERCGPPVLCH